MTDETLRRRAYGCAALILVCVLGLVLALWALVPAPSRSRNLDGIYDNAPFHHWFKSQYNAKGQWCCDVADGHGYDGAYRFGNDGSVTLGDLFGQSRTIESFKVLKGPNPTGHAVVWYTLNEVSGQPTIYCFAPGPLS